MGSTGVLKVGLFNEDDIAEIEKLAQAYYDSLDAAENKEDAATI